MTGPRASLPADPAEHPLRAALARGDRLAAHSEPALGHMLAAGSEALLGEAVVAQLRGLFAHLADQLTEDVPEGAAHARARDDIFALLVRSDTLRAHGHALALEWRLAVALEAELALDPVLSPLLQALVAASNPSSSSLAMAALAAQARFAQSQRRMELPLGELPAELFHAALQVRREVLPDGAAAEQRLRADFDEATSRAALLGRLVREDGALSERALRIEEAGVALWLTALAERAGESRERITLAAADPYCGRLLLTLRAAGLGPLEAERQVVQLHPEVELPRGLQDVGTREAAQWLAEART